MHPSQTGNDNISSGSRQSSSDLGSAVDPPLPSGLLAKEGSIGGTRSPRSPEPWGRNIIDKIVSPKGAKRGQATTTTDGGAEQNSKDSPNSKKEAIEKSPITIRKRQGPIPVDASAAKSTSSDPKSSQLLNVQHIRNEGSSQHQAEATKMTLADAYRLSLGMACHLSGGQLREDSLNTDIWGAVQIPRSLTPHSELHRHRNDTITSTDPLAPVPRKTCGAGNASVLSHIIGLVPLKRVVATEVAPVRLQITEGGLFRTPLLPLELPLGAKEIWLEVTRRPFMELWPDDLPRLYPVNRFPQFHHDNPFCDLMGKKTTMAPRDVQEPSLYEINTR